MFEKGPKRRKLRAMQDIALALHPPSTRRRWARASMDRESVSERHLPHTPSSELTAARVIRNGLERAARLVDDSLSSIR